MAPDLDILQSKPIVVATLLVITVIVAEIVLRVAKHTATNTLEQEKMSAENAADLEQITLRYNKRIQVLDIIRLGILFFALLLACLAYDVQAFSYLLVTLGALVIAMRETVNSLISYFSVLSHYEIGEDIRTQGVLGEIVRIKPLATSLVGKDDNGEYNGKLIHIPNYILANNIVEQQELKSDNYRRVTIQAVYSHSAFPGTFDEWLKELKKFLDSEMPLRKTEQVGHYRSYAGSRYKINYDYDTDGEVFVRISFVSSPTAAIGRKEKIIEFIESLRHEKKKKRRED